MLHLIKPFNFILAIDSYKADHFLEMPADAKYSYSVIVPRKRSAYASEIVAVGQTFVAHVLSTVRITDEMIDEAEVEIEQQGYEFNRAGWEIIAHELDGQLPLAMYAVEEGRVVKPQTPILGLINTDERFAWLPASVETWTQGVVWKMSTVASICRAARITIKEFMIRSGADLSMLDWKCHNFGDRGADGAEEAAVLAGIAHATMFNGSDCTRANGYIKALYGTDKAYTSSVEATEHSVMCANSDAASRDDFGAAQMAVKRLHKVVERTKRGIGIPLLSVVIDTYDSRRFVRNYMGGVFKEEIINSGGVMVFRPDSGDPTVEPGLVGNDVETTFGLAGLSDTGHKILHPATAVIQGDGIHVVTGTLRSVLEGWVDQAGYSMQSLTLGMGGGTTHDGSRDDFSFSMKAVALCDSNGWRHLLKDPVADHSKRSLSGLVRCVETSAGEIDVIDFMGTRSAGFFESTPGWRLWSKDGQRLYRQSFDDVQARARTGV
jgi:nicotinamide phosphoribosyltransferase